MHPVHQHLRKRSGRVLHPYPSARLWVQILDGMVYVAGVLGPLLTIPQILKIYLAQDAHGVSAITWGSYAFLNIPWIIYGIVHGERPITIAYILWFLCNTTVLVGVLLFGEGLF